MKNNKIAYINRTNKYVIQTPQSLLFKNWITKKIKPQDTDLFSYLGISLLNKNHIIEGNWKNLKLTTKSDFETLNNHD
jgi:2-C-methyl-D-erythritol 4-phosphate cytidylyltransferase